MGIFHKVTTNEEFVLNITAAQPKAINATTSVDDNAFELMFDPLDGANGNVIAWSTLYSTYPNRGLQINAQSNPELDRDPVITYLQANTSQRQDGSEEGIFSLDVTTLTSINATVIGINQGFNAYFSAEEGGGGVDTLIRTSRSSVSASNDHFFRLKDGIRIHRNGNSIYVEDTVNSSPRVTWALGTNGSGATFSESGTVPGYVIGGDSTYEDARDAANDIRNNIEETFNPTQEHAEYTLTNMPEAFGGIQVLVNGIRVYNWQQIAGTRTLRFFNDVPTVTSPIPGNGDTVLVRYYATAGTAEPLGTEYVLDGGATTWLGYANNLVDSTRFASVDLGMTFTINGTLDDSNRFRGWTIEVKNNTAGQPTCPIGAANDGGTAGRWRLYYGDHNNGNSTQPGWFSTLNSTRFFCNLPLNDSTLTNQEKIERMVTTFVDNIGNTYNGGTINTVGTTYRTGTNSFEWILGNNEGDLYDLNVTLSNISDNNSVVLSNNETGFIPTYTAYNECDKIQFTDNASLTIDNGNTLKLNYWMAPVFLANNTRLTIDNASKLQMVGTGKYQITGNGQDVTSPGNGLLFEILNGSSYDVLTSNPVGNETREFTGFTQYDNGANSSTQWFPAQLANYNGLIEVNFQNSTYFDASASKSNFAFAPGTYNNFKAIFNKRDGQSQPSFFLYCAQDKILDNFQLDLLSGGGETGGLQIFGTASTSYTSPDTSNPRFTTFSFNGSIPATETVDGEVRTGVGASWWNVTNFTYNSAALWNRFEVRDFEDPPAANLETFRGRLQNLHLVNFQYQGPETADGEVGLFPYSAYNVGYGYSQTSGAPGENGGFGTTVMSNTYNPDFFFGGQPLDRVIDSFYYQDNTIEDLKVCIEGSQGLANQPESGGFSSNGTDHGGRNGAVLVNAGGDLGFPNIVNNTVDTSANIYDNTKGGKQNHPWNPTNLQESIEHSVGANGDTNITATTANQAGQLEPGTTFIQHSSTSITTISSGLTITSVGGFVRWSSGLPQPADLSAVNGIRITSSNNTYETSVSLTFDSDNRDSGTITFGNRPGEIQALTQFDLVDIVDSVTSNHTVTGVDSTTGVITFTPALVGDLQSPTFFETFHTYVTDAEGLEDVRYSADNKLIADITYQGNFNENNGLNIAYIRGLSLNTYKNPNTGGSFVIPRLYTDYDDQSGTMIEGYFGYRRRNGFRPAFLDKTFNEGEITETIVFDPILDPYWESNTLAGIKVFTDAIDVIKNVVEKDVEISTGTVSIETVPNSTGIPNNHNSIYRRIELADNEQLVTGTKTSYSGRASKFSRVFDLDNPVQGNLAILNPNIGLTLLVRDDLFKGTGAEASTIIGYNVGDNECEIDVAGTRTLQMDVEGNAGGAGIRLTQGGSAFLSLSESTWNAESVTSAIVNNLLSSNITTIGDQTYQMGCLLGNTTLTTAAGDVTCSALLQGTTSTIDLDAGTLTASGATTFIVGSMIDVDTVAMGSTFAINDSTIITNFITGGDLSMANNSRLEIFNDSTLSGTMDDSTIITDGDLTLTNTTQSMTITGFGGDENISLGGVADGDIIANVGDVTYDADAHITNNTITASGTITLSDQVTGPLGSNSTFTAATITQPSTTGNLIDRCNLIADSVTVTNATDCIMDGTTTNIIIGDSLRNLWLHDGRVNPGAGVTTPTSTEDTITVNGVDLRLTGNITSLGVGSGIRAGYIATLNNFIDGNVDCEELFVDKNITGSIIDTYQLNSTDFPGNDTITSNITIGKLLSTDADQPTSVIEDNVSSTISLRHNTHLILEGTQEASTAASISGPTDTNTAQVDFGTPVEGGFLTDITILNAAVSDTQDWSPLSFDNVDIDATQVGRIKFASTGDVNILRGPQPSGTVSDFDQSSSALQAWKEDSPGFVNLDWVGALAVAPIPINTVATANGWEFLVVDQKQAGGEIWKIIKGTETSETGVYNLRAEVHSTAQTTVSVSNGIGGDVVITTPADFADAPAGSGDATTPNAEVQAYYDQAPWSVFLPIEPFTLTFTRPGIHRLEVHYTDLGGVRQAKYLGYGADATDTITLDETEVQINTTVNAYTSAADSLGVGMGTTAYDVLGTTANIEVSTNNLKSGSFDRPLTTADAAARFNSATTTGTVSQKKLFLSGSMLDAEEQSEAALSQIWLEGMSNITQTTSTSALIEIIIQESNANFFGFQQSRFTYNENRMSFTSTTAVSASTEENSSFMLHTGGTATARAAQNIATAGNEFFGINTVPSVTFTSPEQIEEILNERDLTKDNVGNLGLGIPTDVS